LHLLEQKIVACYLPKPLMNDKQKVSEIRREDELDFFSSQTIFGETITK